MIWTLLFGALKAIPGLAEKLLDWQIKRANIDLEGFKTGAGIDAAMYQAYLTAQVETNRMKLAANAWWGAKLIILTAGWPCAIHMAAVMLDSLPFWIPMFMSQAHPIGGWGVAKLPAPYDGYQRDIVLSFFIVMPAMPIVSGIAQWLGRRR
jgi:hypothetical protein